MPCSALAARVIATRVRSLSAAPSDRSPRLSGCSRPADARRDRAGPLDALQQCVRPVPMRRRVRPPCGRARRVGTLSEQLERRSDLARLGRHEVEHAQARHDQLVRCLEFHGGGWPTPPVCRAQLDGPSADRRRCRGTPWQCARPLSGGGSSAMKCRASLDAMCRAVAGCLARSVSTARGCATPD